jgi:hypothetical protein
VEPVHGERVRPVFPEPMRDRHVAVEINRDIEEGRFQREALFRVAPAPAIVDEIL